MKCLKLIILIISLTTISCSRIDSNSKNNLKKFDIDVVYGNDNRKDFYEINDNNWVDLAQSTVALMDYRDLVASSNLENYNIKSQMYGKSYHLCEDERFYSQPKASFCSGFLIGRDTIVTAGHCIRNKYNCENVRFVFGYSYTSKNQTIDSVSRDNVYSCSSVVHTITNALTGEDIAIVKTDRPVVNASPLLLRRSGEISLDDPLTVIGYPAGIPGKYADSGLVRDNSQKNFFVTTLDTYGGNSGSAVFNSNTRLVEGILVRGEDDFVYDQNNKCRRSYVCSESACRGEDVVRIGLVYNYITPADL